MPIDQRPQFVKFLAEELGITDFRVSRATGNTWDDFRFLTEPAPELADIVSDGLTGLDTKEKSLGLYVNAPLADISAGWVSPSNVSYYGRGVQSNQTTSLNLRREVFTTEDEVIQYPDWSRHSALVLSPPRHSNLDDLSPTFAICVMPRSSVEREEMVVMMALTNKQSKALKTLPRDRVPARCAIPDASDVVWTAVALGSLGVVVSAGICVRRNCPRPPAGGAGPGFVPQDIARETVAEPESCDEQSHISESRAIDRSVHESKECAATRDDDDDSEAIQLGRIGVNGEANDRADLLGQIV